MKLIQDIILPGIILLILDSIYISFISNSFQLQIISVQRVTMTIRILGAIICYALLIFGLYYLFY